MRGRFLSLLAVATTLTGCIVGPDYQPPQTTIPMQWVERNADALESTAPESWWDRFNDPILSELLRKTANDNKSMKIAAQRIAQARAEFRIAKSLSLPSLGFGGAAESRRQTQTLDWPPPATAGVYPYYQVGFDASWELDLFGGTRRRQEAAQASIGEAEEAERGILVSLLAEVASDYFGYRVALIRLHIAQDSVKTAQDALRLSTHAYEGASVPGWI